MQTSNSCLIGSWIANVTYSINRIFLYLSEDRALSTSSGIRFQVSREVLPFVFPFRFVSCHCPRVHKNPTKKYHCPRSVLAFAISFQIRFVEFVSVVESCCWFSVFVVVVQSPVAVCLFPPLSHPPLPKQQVNLPNYSTCPR